MKKVVWLVVVLISVFAFPVMAVEGEDAPSVKSSIKLEYQGQGYDFRAWLTQQRKIGSVPIWWDVIVADNKTINLDAGWNPTINFANGFASFWLMPGVTLDASDMNVISWKADFFAFQKIGSWSFDQEWMYFIDTHKNWFRFFTYFQNTGLQTTGMIYHEVINLTLGPRYKMIFGGQKLEFYGGMWGVKNINVHDFQWSDVSGHHGEFFARYTIQFK